MRGDGIPVGGQGGQPMRENRVWIFDPFRLDIGNEQLWHGHEVLRLTRKTFAVMQYLVEHHSQLVTKDELFAAV